MTRGVLRTVGSKRNAHYHTRESGAQLRPKHYGDIRKFLGWTNFNSHAVTML